MERFTIQQRLEIVKSYYQNGSSIRQTFRALRPVFGVYNRPSERTIRRVMEKLEATGSVADQKLACRQRRNSTTSRNREKLSKNKRSNENIAVVRESEKIS